MNPKLAMQVLEKTKEILTKKAGLQFRPTESGIAMDTLEAAVREKVAELVSTPQSHADLLYNMVIGHIQKTAGLTKTASAADAQLDALYNNVMAKVVEIASQGQEKTAAADEMEELTNYVITKLAKAQA